MYWDASIDMLTSMSLSLNSAGIGTARVITLDVGTATAAVRLGDVVPVGKKKMAAADWARGARLEAGTVLGAL